MPSRGGVRISGPNGAGKTTTIRLVCGLIRADSGEIEICGENLEKQFEKAMSHVGAIVENPEHYRHMTGWQNLKLYQNMRPGISEERMKEVVHLVDWKTASMSRYAAILWECVSVWALPRLFSTVRSC